jgi:hypothetical protein
MVMPVLMHSWRLVFGNLGAALRISLPLLLVLIVGGGIFFFVVASSVGSPGSENNSTIATVVWTGVMLLAGVWVAVAWHRFVLLDEVPRMLPEWRGKLVWAYTAKSFILVGVLMVAALSFSLVMTAVIAASGGAVSLIGLATVLYSCIATAIMYRLSVMLPSAALGRSMSVKDAWKATKGMGGHLLLLAFMTNVASGIIDWPIQAFATDQTGLTLALAWGVVSVWIKVMVGLSILTALYGHLVEGRSLGGKADRPSPA